MQVQFKCPKCGDRTLVETMTDVTVHSECSWDQEFGIIYSEQTNEDGGEIIGYQCYNGHWLESSDGDRVVDVDGLGEWFQFH